MNRGTFSGFFREPGNIFRRKSLFPKDFFASYFLLNLCKEQQQDSNGLLPFFWDKTMEERPYGTIDDPRHQLRPTGGRDELNLAEFPITLLCDRVPKGCKTLVFEIEPRDQLGGLKAGR